MIIRLPTPPSTNQLFANVPGKGRVVSKKYKAWRLEAGLKLNTQNHVGFGSLPVQLGILIPQKTRGDLSNRIKALEDLLVSHRLIDDDKQVKKLTIEYHAEDTALVSVMPFGSTIT